jgi:hypothetical protein
MLKENAMYEKQDDYTGADVALTSKDMEVNFSNKQDDDDELESKMTPAELSGLGDARLIKADSMDIIDDSDLRGVVQGVPEDIKIVEKMKILEEQKDQKKGLMAVK